MRDDRTYEGIVGSCSLLDKEGRLKVVLKYAQQVVAAGDAANVNMHPFIPALEVDSSDLVWVKNTPTPEKPRGPPRASDHRVWWGFGGAGW